MGHDSDSTNFYAALPAFDDFDGFMDVAHYHPLPADWHIVLADIRGSTPAIRAGRYKDVNMIGAASITAVLNALKDLDPVPDVPYVFGGDGATLAVPAAAVDAAGRALMRTRALSEARFGLGLRVGIVPVADVRARDRDIRVAKFRLSPGNFLALFTGGGIETVDALVKDESEGARYRLDKPDGPVTPDLDGLSCRWQPIHARNGHIVSLMALSADADPARRQAVYRRVMAEITRALGVDSAKLSPAVDENLRFRWPPRTLWTEVRATAGPGLGAAFCRACFVLGQSALQWVLHRWGGKLGAYDAPAYKKELIANSDFRRFDDTLRLVLDCSDTQVTALEASLAALRRTDGIVYGLHAAPTALMTCLVFSVEQSSHVHFIDGGDGGLAAAATMMKAQMAGSSVP